MKNDLNIKIWPPKGSKVCKVYLLDKDGYLIQKTGYRVEDIDEEIMVKCDDCEKPSQLKPKWDFENKKWIESATEEELLTRFEQQKLSIIESNRIEVSRLCLSIASELEQSNWVNFPEDYDPKEIEDMRNQIREIRKRGREIREQLASCQNLDEISQIDMRMIEEPEIENNVVFNVDLE